MELKFHCPHCGEEIVVKDGHPLVQAIENRLSEFIEELEKQADDSSIIKEIDGLLGSIEKMEGWREEEVRRRNK